MQRPVALAVLTLLSVAPTALQAQHRGRLSEEASVSQTVDGTRIRIEYFRPRVRGRNQIFGKQVHWNESWTPGANWATVLDVSKDVTIEGRPLAKGRYSMWFIVRESGDWTLVLDPKHRRWHLDRPDSTAEQPRLPVKRASGPFTEVLTWSFPEVRMDGTLLTLQWADTRAVLNLEVQPTYQITTPEAIAEAYVGRYSYLWKDDSTKAYVLIVTYENGSLMARYEPPDSYWNPIMLIPIAEHWFIPGVYLKGKLYEMEKEIVFEFAVTGGRAGEITVRDEGDGVIATAKRIP